MSELFLRYADISDSKDIWEWRNDPQSVEMFKSRKIVSWSEHEKWFRSVFNKQNIYELCDFLISNEYTIYSSGGTYKYLSDKYNTNIKLISDLTKFPEILNGRVKTLHPKIFGGLLADRSNDQHLKDLKSINSSLIDLVVVNLYPF